MEQPVAYQISESANSPTPDAKLALVANNVHQLAVPGALDRASLAWRRVVTEDNATAELYADIAESLERSSWTSLGCQTFAEFCKRYLATDVERMSDILLRRFGKVRYRLLVVAESNQGQRADLDPTLRRAGEKLKSLRTDTRTRAAAVAVKAFPGTLELLEHEVLTWDEAGKLGGKLSSEQADAARELGRRAKSLVVQGSKEARKEVRLCIEQILGNPAPKESFWAGRLAVLHDDALRQALAAVPIDRLRVVLPPEILCRSEALISEQPTDTKAQPESASEDHSINSASTGDGDHEVNNAGSGEDIQDEDSDECAPVSMNIESSASLIQDPEVPVSAIGARTAPKWALIESAGRRAVTEEDAHRLELKGLISDIEIVVVDAERVLAELGPIGDFAVNALSNSVNVVRRRATALNLRNLKEAGDITPHSVLVHAYTTISTNVGRMGLGQAAEDGTHTERVWVLTRDMNGDLVWLLAPKSSRALGKNYDSWCGPVSVEGETST